MKKTILLLLGLGLAPGPAGAADWHVRLTVTAPDDMPPVRVDSGNVFGRLHDSADGLDSHDIVFLHPEWNGEFPI